MKNVISTVVITSSLLMSSQWVHADNTIKFRGEIYDSTCSVSPSSNGQTVEMGKIGRNAFEAIGNYAGSKPFSISFEDCAKEARIDIKFSGIPDKNNSHLLQLSAADSETSAQGVGIAIYRAGDLENPLPLGEIDESKAVTVSSDTKINYVAKYMATADQQDIKAGIANAEAQFTVQYF